MGGCLRGERMASLLRHAAAQRWRLGSSQQRQQLRLPEMTTDAAGVTRQKLLMLQQLSLEGMRSGTLQGSQRQGSEVARAAFRGAD